MKYSIAFITFIIVTFLAARQNRKFEEVLENSGENVLEGKLKWAYQFNKIRLKTFFASFAGMFFGVFMFGYALSRPTFEIVNDEVKNLPSYDWMIYLGIATVISSFLYLVIRIGTKSARYNLLIKEFNEEKINVKEVFKKWKEEGI